MKSASIFCASIATHYPIAIYAIERGLHVLITKPATQLLSHHNALIEAARKHNVLCFVEHHKRSVVVLNVKLQELSYLVLLLLGLTPCIATQKPRRLL